MEWLAEKLLVPILVAVAAAILLAVNWHRVRGWIKSGDLAPLDSERFTMLIAELDGDDDGGQTGHIVNALTGRPGIQVVRDGRALVIEKFGDRADNLAAAERKGQEWLAEKGADILIWGEVAHENKVLRLRILSPAGSGGDKAQGYSLGEGLELPESFDRDLAEAIYAGALSATAPATERQGHYSSIS